MKKHRVQILLTIIVFSAFFFHGCSSKEKDQSPIIFSEESEKQILSEDYPSPMSTYNENLRLKISVSDNRDNFEETVNYVLALLPDKPSLNADKEKIRKAIDIISDEQRLNSNPYNQLLLYNLKSHLFRILGNRTASQAEKLNFTELYNRVMNLE